MGGHDVTQSASSVTHRGQTGRIPDNPPQVGRCHRATAICHGKKGELFHHYERGLENQLGVLGLVLNAVVLWTTVYLNAAIRQLKTRGYPVLDEDAARLSPFVRKHLGVTVHPKLEKVKMGGKVPGGGTFTLVARVSPCSPLSAAMATLGLAIATCLVAGVAHAIGVPAMAAMITGLGASICIFVLVRVLSGRWTATPRR